MAKKHGIIKSFMQEVLDGLRCLVLWVIKLALLVTVIVLIVVGEIAILGKVGNYPYGRNFFISYGVWLLIIILFAIYSTWDEDYLKFPSTTLAKNIGDNSPWIYLLLFILFILASIQVPGILLVIFVRSLGI